MDEIAVIDIPATETPATAADEEDRDPVAVHEQATRQLLDRLRLALAASEPGLDPALVTGDTLEEVEASFAAACGLLSRVREAVRREAAVAVPAGAPGRSAPVTATPFEKIRAGLGRLG